jgi:hypothetical protein
LVNHARWRVIVVPFKAAKAAILFALVAGALYCWALTAPAS